MRSYDTQCRYGMFIHFDCSGTERKSSARSADHFKEKKGFLFKKEEKKKKGQTHTVITIWRCSYSFKDFLQRMNRPDFHKFENS